MAKANLKAVPATPDVDLSEFRSSLRGLPLWRSIVEQLGPDDEAKLRGALLAVKAAPSIVDWLEIRGITVSEMAVRNWRRKNYATIA